MRLTTIFECITIVVRFVKEDLKLKFCWAIFLCTIVQSTTMYRIITKGSSSSLAKKIVSSTKKTNKTDLVSALFVTKSTRKYASVKRPRAAALIIGDEILNGTVADVNTTELAKFLFTRGIEFDRVEIVPDKEDVIIESLKKLSPNHEFVFTTGGIGPTHDDITYPAVAKAFGRELEFHEQTLEKMKEFYAQRKEELNEARKRMALIPAKANVTYPFDPKSWVPLVNIENVYIFPGVPSMFKQMLNNSGTLFPVLPPKARAVVYTNFPEGEIAEFLTNIQNKFPDCRIGSYPTMDANAGYRVKVNVEGDSMDDVEDVARSFQRQFNGFREVKKSAEGDAKKEKASEKPAAEK